MSEGNYSSKEELNRLWEQLDREAMDYKASHMAYVKLKEMYARWDQDTRRNAIEVFAEWLRSENARKRFDALSLIDEFDIVDARPALESLAMSLVARPGPEAKHELKRVNEILQRL